MTLAQIQAATLKARSESGMPGIGTEVQRGRFRVVNVTFLVGGRPIIDPLSDWISAEAAVGVLEDIAADAGWRQ